MSSGIVHLGLGYIRDTFSCYGGHMCKVTLYIYAWVIYVTHCLAMVDTFTKWHCTYRPGLYT